MTNTADPFSVAPSDVLQNLFSTTVGSSTSFGYNTFLVNAAGVMGSRVGQTVRLRIAEVDNVANLNVGVDAVSIGAVPEPATWGLLAAALLTLGAVKRHKWV